MNFDFEGNSTDFKDIFYLYAKQMEGYRDDVYKDIKGYPTVGIGHLVEPSDNLTVGQVISDSQVQQLFNNDYGTLNIDTYIQEGANNYNQGLAIAHFIWGHGETEYKNSELRQHVINNDLDYNGMIAYLNSNWDLSSPTNQRVNSQDFSVYYSSTPWTPNGAITIMNNINALVHAYPTTSIVVISVVTLLMSYGVWLAVRKRKKK